MNESQKAGPKEEENEQDLNSLDNQPQNLGQEPQAARDITREQSFWDTAEIS